MPKHHNSINLNSQFEVFHILWSFLKLHKKHSAICVALILLNAIFLGGTLSLLLPVLSQFFSSDLTAAQGNASYFGKVIEIYQHILGDSPHKEIFSIGILFFMMSLSSIIQFLIVYANSGLTAKITCDCRDRLYSSIQSLPFYRFSNQQRGMYVQLLITETRSVYAVFKQLLNILATAINTVVLVTLLMLLSWKLCTILLIFYFSTVWINLVVVREIKMISKKALMMRSEFANQVTESIFGLKQLRLLQAESVFKSKLAQASVISENLARKLAVKNGILPLVSFNNSLLGVLILVSIWLSFPVFSEEVSKAAGLITFLVLVGKLASYLGSISKEYGTILGNLPALSRVKSYLVDHSNDKHKVFWEPEHFLEDAIIIDNISFHYSPDTPILQNLSLTIHRGSYVGIIGESGGGKSTLFELLLQLYSPTSGRIMIDGNDIGDIRQSYLRSKINLVSQDFFLFNTTIRENMLFAKKDASEQELQEALEKAKLIEFVDLQEKGLDTLVGDNGGNLSGGQRQRLSLAIAFLRSPEVIIIDEGTSSVDRETENHLLHSLRELHKQGMTIICSAHKETALVDAEYIYRLKNGQISREK